MGSGGGLTSTLGATAVEGEAWASSSVAEATTVSMQREWCSGLNMTIPFERAFAAVRGDMRGSSRSPWNRTIRDTVREGLLVDVSHAPVEHFKNS
jgi:hypothetical protein